MVEPEQVGALLREDVYFEDMSQKDIMPACETAVLWLKRHIKDGADGDSPLACKTAAAMARFYIFVSLMGKNDSYGSFKVGDVTVKRDLQKEYEIEKELRTQALCDAAEILKDGGFYFAAN